MAGTSAECGGGLPACKKRKIRKGTQSCWECKRRKIRCTFVAPTESICDGCKSRRVKCISQEYYNEGEATNRKADRLDRVEALVEQLTKRVNPDLPSLLPQETQEEATERVCRVASNTNVPLALPNTSLLSIQSPSRPVILANHDELCGTLLAAWPSQCELDIVMSVNVGTSVLFHGTVCMPYSDLLCQDMPSPQDLLQLPSPGSHPVLIARKLLMLGAYLQGIAPVAVKDLERRGVKCREVMSHVVETASRLVTSNDYLVESIEGIECIMIESMYQNNAGNLRHAWLANRRAMTIAQMMGLHLGNLSLSDMLDVETRKRVDPEYMWARLIFSDRYLSLMLGLPQGSQDSPFATSKALDGCAPIDRMERLEAVVGGLILQRNRDDSQNLETTLKIDRLLQDAAASMPAQWWLTPDMACITGVDANAFRETIRIMNHFTHYHLLTQLHLPYMLQSSTDSKYNYSRITAVNASRETLSRFVRFRGSNKITAYCRGVDFLAFIASTTLCLAHIDARRRQEVGMSNRANVFDFLAHQRLGDRGLMERTLEIMEEMMVESNNDAIACKIASFLRPLLIIEATTANDGSCTAGVSSEPGEPGFLSNSHLNDSTDVLRINVPWVGTIIIDARSPGGYQIGHEPATINWQGVPSYLHSMRPAGESHRTTNDREFSSLDEIAIPDRAADGDAWALQGVDIALFDSFIRWAEA